MHHSDDMMSIHKCQILAKNIFHQTNFKSFFLLLCWGEKLHTKPYIKWSHRNNPANGSKCETFWSISSATASKFSRFVDRSIAAILTGLQWLVHQDQDDNSLYSEVKRYILSIIVLDHYKVKFRPDNCQKKSNLVISIWLKL